MSITLERFIRLAAPQNGQYNVRHLSCNADDSLLGVEPVPLVLEIGVGQRVIIADCSPTGLHQHRPDLFVSTKGLLAMSNLLATTMTCRNQSKIGGELFLVPETTHIIHLCQDCHSAYGSDAGNAMNQAIAFSIFGRLAEMPYRKGGLQKALAGNLGLIQQQVQRQSCG